MAGRSVRAPLLVATLVSTSCGLDTLFDDSVVGFCEGISAFFAYSLPYTLLFVVMVEKKCGRASLRRLARPPRSC